MAGFHLACDLCDRPIRKMAMVHDLVHAHIIMTDSGEPRIKERGAIASLYLCPACTQAVQDVMQRIRRAADAAAAAEAEAEAEANDETARLG